MYILHIQERNDKYGEILIAPTTVSKNSKLGVSPEYIKQIVMEEQHLIDSGIDMKKAMALTHREDRERYKSAREKQADAKREERRLAKEFYARQASERIHMPS